MAQLINGLLLAFALLAATAQAQDEAAFELIGQKEGSKNQQIEIDANLLIPETLEKQERCIQLHKRGQANSRLGRYQNALTDLKAALSLSENAWLIEDGWCDQWRLQNDLSQTYMSSGLLLERLAFLQGMSSQYANSNARQYFFTLMPILETHIILGQVGQAEKELEKAGQIYNNALTQGKNAGIYAANVSNQYERNTARVLDLKGNHVEAERFYRRALVHALSFIERMNVSGNLQMKRVARGNYSLTLRLLSRNLALQGKYGEAEYQIMKVLESDLTYLGANTVAVANTLSLMGLLKLEQGKIETAQKYLELSLRSFEASEIKPFSQDLANARALLGIIYGIQDRWEASNRLFERRDAGLRLNPEQFAIVGSRHLEWAMAKLQLGNTAEALEMLRVILKAQQAKSYVGEAELAKFRGYYAVALSQAGRHAEALSQFRLCIPELQKALTEQAEGEENGVIKTDRLNRTLDGYLTLLAKIHATGEKVEELDPVAEAFRIADIARGSSVQRAISLSAARSNISDPTLLELVRQEQDVTARIQSLSKVQLRLASAPKADRLNKVIEDMSRDIEQFKLKQTDLRRKISKSYPEYAALIDPKPPTPQEVQRVLRSDEAVIGLFTGKKQSYVWTITPKAVSFRVLPVTRAQMADSVFHLRKAFDLSTGEVQPFDHAQSHALFAQLLAPDADQWRGSKTLNIITHAELGQLPFGVLLTKKPEMAAAARGKENDQAWLIKEAAIVQQASANGFLTLRKSKALQSAPSPFIGFGDPVFSSDAPPVDSQPSKLRNLSIKASVDKAPAIIENLVVQPAQKPEKEPSGTASLASQERPTLSDAFDALPQLPDTALELKEIAATLGAGDKDVFLNKRATESNIKSQDLSNYRVLAIATHGLKAGEVSDLNQPALVMSNPKLSGDKDNDGFLTLEEVLSLKLNADWVLLSACNTASPDGSASEAISGLGRGFFFAGARSLLVSNWAVESVSARHLTTGIFKHQSASPQSGRGESLRQSILDLMQRNGGTYGHPVFWAPFTLVGEGS